MSDFAGGADAPADTLSATVEAPDATPQPVKVEPAPQPDPEKQEAEKAPSTRDALRKAAEKVEKAQPTVGKDDKGNEPKPPSERVPADPAKDEAARKAAEDKTKEPPAAEPTKPVEPKLVEPPKPSQHKAPERFSPDAKAAWEAAPESVRAETTRMERELTQGYEKHKQSAEAYEAVREFDEVARKNGGNLRASLEQIVAIETAFARDPISGFQKVADHFGFDLRAVAAHITGQKPEQVQSQQDATIRELRQELASLKNEFGSVSKTVQEQKQTQVLSHVQEFAKSHPRFEELADPIKEELGHGYDLATAYERAERLHPAPASPAPVPAASSAAAIPDLAAQTRKGSQSITGAPTPGSNPTRKTPFTSIRDSLRRAAAAAG